ncbi:phospholipid N-methyltransferase [Kutzneria viridogrisea]|nr:phospholipid N-methyltransferase [Kutzneria viridogrisea]
MTKPLHDLRVFLSALRRRPAAIGAIAPSGPTLAGLLASVAPSTGEPVVVELGPGTGSATRALGRRLPATARHLAVEIDGELVEHLRTAHPGLEVVHGDAAHLAKLLAERDVQQVDAVISGLPWALFPEELQRAILEQVGAVLAPGGAFATFAYVHALPMGRARRFRALLAESFDEVIVTRVVWANVPPAISYICRRPVVRTDAG